jgi:hypothetical protein
MKSIIKRILICLQLLLATIFFKLTQNKKKKIIIGVSEIANVLFNLKKLFNQDCIVICKERNRFFMQNNYDIDYSKSIKVIKLILSAYYLGILAKNSKYFIYLWDDGFLLNREMDFQFLKKYNIPIICYFLGSDIRSRKLFLEYCNSINFNTGVEYDRPELFLSDFFDAERKRLANQADKYATIIFSHKYDQISYLKSKQYFFPPIIDEKLFFFNRDKFDKKPIRIVHAPSSPVAKGTPVVRSVIKMLKNEGYDFIYIELINVSHENVICELKQSHIVLNQFYSLIPGIFGLEAMATCNAVLMSAKSDQFPYFFNNAWLETEDWQLYYNLKFLLENPEKIFEYAKNGFEYMSNNFTIKAIREHLAKIFEENGLTL